MDILWSEQPEATNNTWTVQVKAFLDDLGKSLGNSRENLSVEVLCTNAAVGTSEFLLDVVWWCRSSGSSEQSESMALAAEIEWSSWGPAKGERRDHWVRDRVGEDFGKLTVVKCPLKLMVFCTDPSATEQSHGPMQQIVLEEIDRYLRSYAHHIPGEHYVLLDVASHGHRRAWLRSVDQNGVLSTLQELPA